MQIQEFSSGKVTKENPARVVAIDCIFYHYLSRELRISSFYRKKFCKAHKSHKFRFILIPTCYNTIDYQWNDRVDEMVRERCELDNALSWLSTLGGAFSALGDYFENCALIAGKISANQLKLALRLGDPTIASRCRLYFSLSLIQQQRFKLARYIICEEFKAAKNSIIGDGRLVKMCKGIWSKLQYEHNTHRNRKKMENMKLILK